MEFRYSKGKKGCNLRLGIVKNFPGTGGKNLSAVMGNRSLQMAGRFFQNDHGQTAGQTKQY
jgi:hypothetical protein